MELTGKNICLTGGNGFLGKNIKGYFNKMGIDILSPSHTDYDLSDLNETSRMFSELSPDIVIHAAADVGGIGYNRLFPADIFRNNLAMALNILEVSSNFNIKKLVLMGSACAYPGNQTGDLVEEDFLDGAMHESVEVYGFSKRALYLGAKAYKNQNKLDSIFLILTNLYGPYDKYDPKESHVVAALIKRFIDAKNGKQKEVVCWGTGNPIREFLYSEDCAEAIYLATKKYDKLEPLNIGSGIGTTIKELSETIKEVVRFEGDVRWDSSFPDGAMKKVLNVDRANKELGWRANTSLKEGIKKTVEWYKNVHSENIRSFF